MVYNNTSLLNNNDVPRNHSEIAVEQKTGKYVS